MRITLHLTRSLLATAAPPAPPARRRLALDFTCLNKVPANIAGAIMRKRKPHYTLETLEASRSIGFLMKRCGVP
jgi:hypothetical protein